MFLCDCVYVVRTVIFFVSIILLLLVVIYFNSHRGLGFFSQKVVLELLVAWVWLSCVGLNGEYDYEYHG